MCSHTNLSKSAKRMKGSHKIDIYLMNRILDRLYTK